MAMRIYTRGGDRGETGLLGGARVDKDDARLEVCGTVDELNSALGMVRAEPLPEEIDKLLCRVQNEMLVIGSTVAAVGSDVQGAPTIGPKHVEALEEAIDRHQVRLDPLGGFILPAGSRAAALLHFARTLCRRGERRLVALARSDRGEVSANLMAYLNRLSDLLFVLARAANAQAGCGDTLWQESP